MSKTKLDLRPFKETCRFLEEFVKKFRVVASLQRKLEVMPSFKKSKRLASETPACAHGVNANLRAQFHVYVRIAREPARVDAVA